MNRRLSIWKRLQVLVLALTLGAFFVACTQAEPEAEEPAVAAEEEAVEEMAAEEPDEAEAAADEEMVEFTLPDNTLKFGIPSPAVMSYASVYFAPPLRDALQEHGIEVALEKYKGYQPFVAGLLNGEFQVGAVAFPSLVNSSVAGVDIKAPLGHTQQLLWVMLVSPEIGNWEDLSGQTIAYHSEDSTTNVAARAMVGKSPIDLDSINWAVIPGTPNRVIALEEGQIQGTTVSLESALDAEERGTGRLLAPFAEMYPGHINDLIVLSPKFREENPELADFVLDKLRENINWARTADPAEAADMVMESGFFPGYSKETWTETFRRLQAMEMFPEDGRISHESVQQSQELLNEYNLLEGTVEYEDIVMEEYQP